MGRFFAAGNYCGPSWSSLASPGAAPHTPTTPQLSLRGLKGVNTSELSGERDADTGGRNKRCGPRAVLTTGKNCHIAHTPQHAGPQTWMETCTHTQGRLCTDPDRNAHRWRHRPRRNDAGRQAKHPDVSVHTCAYIHSHIQSHPHTYRWAQMCTLTHPGHSDRPTQTCAHSHTQSPTDSCTDRHRCASTHTPSSRSWKHTQMCTY